MKKIVVGVSGASGSVLAVETLRQLRNAGVESHLVVSRSAPVTIAHELGPCGLSRLRELASVVHEAEDIAAPIASGSYAIDGMVIVPCSMRTLAAIAHGLADNLLTRAADVTLKERRKLVILPREAPLHEIHLGSMLTLARMGAVIAPPVPHFYTRPKSVEDIVREIAARALGWLGIDPGAEMSRWNGPAAEPMTVPGAALSDRR